MFENSTVPIRKLHFTPRVFPFISQFRTNQSHNRGEPLQPEFHELALRLLELEHIHHYPVRQGSNTGNST